MPSSVPLANQFPPRPRWPCCWRSVEGGTSSFRRRYTVINSVFQFVVHEDLIEDHAARLVVLTLLDELESRKYGSQ